MQCKKPGRLRENFVSDRLGENAHWISDMPRTAPRVLFAALVLFSGFVLAFPNQLAAQAASTEGKETNAVEGCTLACLDGDCQSGAGRQLQIDCSRYAGQFRNGLRYGRGQYHYANGDRYEGDYQAGLRHGQGAYQFANGDRFEGRFVAGQPRGRGQYIFADGRRFDGDFRDAWRASGVLLANPMQQCSLENGRLRCTGELRPSLLLIFAGEDVSVHRAGRRLQGRSGFALLPGDRIEAGARPVDIQGSGGLALRLRPHSVLAIPIDIQNSRTLHLERGSIMVDYDRSESAPPLRIRSGGTRFDVEGTTFIVETDDSGDLASVRVLEGEVSVAPDLPGVERIRRDDIEASASLRKLVAAIEKQTVRAGPGQSASLSAETLARAQQLDRIIEQSQADGSDAEAALNNPEAAANLAALAETPAPAPAAYTATAQEKAEQGLMVRVGEQQLQQSLSAAGQADSSPQPAAPDRQIEGEYQRRLEEAASAVAQEVQQTSGTISRAELLEKYGILEVVTFRNGSQKAGSILAQAGSLLLMHALDGVFQVNVDQVHHIDLYSDGEQPDPEQSPAQPTP